MKKLYLISLGVFLVDRATKFAVVRFMELGQTIPVIPGIFQLRYILNPGAAFGILQGQRYFFILTTLAVVVLILVYARQVRDNNLLQVAFGLQLGGAAGNLIDRISSGEVVDFFDFHIWPVFNIADSALVIGVILFALDVVLEWKKERHEA